MKSEKVKVIVTLSRPTLCDPTEPARLLCSWDSPGKDTRVGCHALLQGIFLTQGSNLRLLLSPALGGKFFITSTTWEALTQSTFLYYFLMTAV